MMIPLKQYFTVSPSLLLSYGNNTSSMSEMINLNIFLNDPRLLTSVFFTKVSSLKNNYIFSLSNNLVRDNNILKDILPKLYLLSALNLVSKKNEIIIPIFFDLPNKSEIINTDIITSYFRAQGFENVELPFFDYYNTKDGIQNKERCSFFIYPSNSQSNTNHLFLDKPTEQNLSHLTIIAFEEEISDSGLFDELIHQIINFAGNNLISLTLDDLSKYYIEKEVFEEEEKLWKNRVLLYKNFLSLSKRVQQKEYYEVLKWYHNEYENLPLWYKRFGHIVKVLMGKRSFRSLFSDNVKKYKD